jgi:Lon protease-like protein
MQTAKRTAHNKSMAAPLLPLFPLPLVLFPDTPLPLHIFEERYKEMMGETIAQREEFGVVLAKEAGIANVGCTATVAQVLQRYDDGRLDLLALGRRRFEIASVDEERSFLRAEVEFFDDEELENAPAELRERAVTAYRQLREDEASEPGTEQQFSMRQVSFQLAQALADVDVKQTVLTLRSETERLVLLLSILPGYLAKREKSAMARRLAPLNGHAKHVVNRP